MFQQRSLFELVNMSNPIRVLVIDDDPSDRLIISKMLMSHPDEFRVTCADGLDEAQLLYPTAGFDVVLLDLMLGPTVGVDTLKAFFEVRQDVPVVVLSGVSGEQVALDAVEAGAQDYISKDGVNYEITSRSIKYAIQRHELNRELQAQAASDAVTGLANRIGLADRLHVAMQRAKQPGSKGFAIAFIDLDDFKQVNDIHGHATGDLLLIEFAARLQRCVRKTDAIGRFGGDEFVVLLEDVAQSEDVGKFVERFESELKLPFIIDGRDFYVRASMGLVFYDDHYDSPDEMMRDADTAMYTAKEEGKSGHRWFTSEMRDSAVAKYGIEAQLRNALTNSEFELYYQPLINLQTKELVRFEALIRWHHPVRGLVSPLQFIPMAETSGLIVPIGRWVFEQACRQTARWRKTRGIDIGVSINVSPVQLARHSFVEDVFSTIDTSGVPMNRIELEVTETSVMVNPTRALTMLREFSSAGVRIALDDFGTGFASLSQLYDFEYDVLKVDRSFIGHMLSDGDMFVRAILAMAESLEIEVVAEGIEHPEQAKHLTSIGCQFGQGYYYGMPMPAADVNRFLDCDAYVAPSLLGTRSDLP